MQAQCATLQTYFCRKCFAMQRIHHNSPSGTLDYNVAAKIHGQGRLSAPYLGPGKDDIHEEGLERLHILVSVNLQLALTLHLCNASGGLLQLSQRLCQDPSSAGPPPVQDSTHDSACYDCWQTVQAAAEALLNSLLSGQPAEHATRLRVSVNGND